jgi:hypothetical protein
VSPVGYLARPASRLFRALAAWRDDRDLGGRTRLTMTNPALCQKSNEPHAYGKTYLKVMLSRPNCLEKLFPGGNRERQNSLAAVLGVADVNGGLTPCDLHTVSTR